MRKHISISVLLTVIMIGFSSWGDHPRLIAWYRLNRPTGLNAFNSSPYTVNSIGTLTGGAYYKDMQRGPCLYLDGVNDYVTIPDADIFTFVGATSDNPFSISLWVYNQKVSGNSCRMISKTAGAALGNNEWIMGTNPSGQYSMFLYGGTTGNNISIASTATASADVNQWVQVVGTYTGSETNTGLEIYRNGIKLAVTRSSSGAYTGMTNGTSAVEIGRIFGLSSPQYGLSLIHI